MTDVTITKIDHAAPVPSKYLPGTKIQYAWDSTSLGYLDTCPRLYQYVIIEGWQPKDESIHLRFGLEYHKALEEYDRARAEDATHQEALRHAVRGALERTFGWEVDTDTKAGKYKNRWSLVRMIVGYCDKFKDDPAKTVILETGDPAVELTFKFELDWGPVQRNNAGFLKVGNASQPYLLCGHLDRVVDFNGAYFVMDRKTTTTTPGDYYFDQYSPNKQMSLYTLASKVVLETSVKGVIIDAAQICLQDPDKFVRGFTYRTPDHLEEWTTDLAILLRQAEEYATVGYWRMNDTSCDKFGGCRFRSVCAKSPSVREIYLKSNFVQLPEEDRWNPLKPR